MLVGLRFFLTVSCPALNAPLDGRKFGSKYLVDHEVHFTQERGSHLSHAPAACYYRDTNARS